MSYVNQCKECGNITCASAPRKYTCVCGVELELLHESLVSVSKSRGLGDTIHKLTTALHIPHCGGCEKRRQALNALVPYKKT